MHIAQALHDERRAAKNAGRRRRPRGASAPNLLFTGTPRGSFGLEFTPETTVDDGLLDVYTQSHSNVADALVRVGSSNLASIGDAIQHIPTRVLPPLKQFLKTLAQHRVELRLAFDERNSVALSADQMRAAAGLLETEVIQEVIQIPGTFRGVTRDSGVFDLRTDAGELLTGNVADDFSEEDVERIAALTNNHCIATLQRTTLASVTVGPKWTHMLLDAVID